MKVLTSVTLAVMLSLAPAASFAKDKKMNGPEVVEMADISVGLSGLVCDFCSIALNKTFKKRDEVRGTYVDLDSKILSIALSEGAELGNEDIVELVKQPFDADLLYATRRDDYAGHGRGALLPDV